jgi:parallel beta-helix repeat protein
MGARKVRKVAALIILMPFLSSAILTMPPPSVEAVAGTVRVPQDFPTIHQAIDASSSGGTILVTPGTYHENITVWKSLTIKGENKELTIIDQAGTFAVCHVTANNVTITRLTIKSGSIGVWIDNSDYTTITSNVIRNNDDGVWATSSNGITVDNNIITHNLFMGLYLKASNNTTSNGNTITNNTYGLYIENSEKSSIYENTISLNYAHGIHTEISNHNAIFHNAISNNSLGICLETSSNNSIYENNLMDNLDQAQADNTTTNSWDNRSKGNYWSDYNGTDSNQDGIGDTAYVLDANNQDRYPLMEPFAKPFLLTDINKDGKVNILDIGIIAKSYGTKPEDPRWNPDADIDKNGIINILDIAMVAKDFGKTA